MKSSFSQTASKSIKIKPVAKSTLAVKTLALEKALETCFIMKFHIVKCSTYNIK